jgi:hypothetical protein
MTCFLSWRAWDTPQSRLSFRLQLSVPRTGETESGSSPHQMPLPTPSATEYGSSGNGSGNNTRSRGRPSLGTIAKQSLWATPQAHDGEKGARSNVSAVRKGSRCLAREVKLWPTPDAHDWKSGKGWNPKQQKENGHAPQLRHLSGGQLNPTWVEWLMGFPAGWTDLEL